MRLLSFIFIAAACGSAAPSPDQCISRTVWTRGDDESALMHPGGTCIACHRDEGPKFTIAGTVFRGQKEQTDCYGASGANNALSVVITDATGKILKLPVNEAGNFHSQDSIAKPFRAKVITSTGKENEMTSTQSDGDCNGCHSSIGTNGAPGRILAPVP